ncbi:2Fe-2S iron-sulfur cluster-binding protein [Pseudomonas sp. MYb185]|uniref:2Fe-2S iron-sulfur cluster-binding protein n=1 Tax=Pseudomonas sp. MYb185 TaxID=1848729 RepID=UPI000CFC2FC5|nr:2Fe-2S iron-sulfur cluster binding domain-containing protein [Pseudomonas sp. MYb185]PRB75022.1 ferredoxin [Pseudomonas sp. MYb185]
MKTDTFEITELATGRRFRCQPRQSLLKAMEQTGKCAIPVGCRGGGCGLCKVQICSGAFECGPMSKKHVNGEARCRGQVLACRVYPLSDLTFEYRPSDVPVMTQQQIQ